MHNHDDFEISERAAALASLGQTHSMPYLSYALDIRYMQFTLCNTPYHIALEHKFRGYPSIHFSLNKFHRSISAYTYGAWQAVRAWAGIEKFHFVDTAQSAKIVKSSIKALYSIPYQCFAMASDVHISRRNTSICTGY